MSALLYFYGTFLITCGIVAVAFIGLKAKTALASGGSAGVIAILVGWLHANQNASAAWVGILLSLALLVVFSWRATKTLQKVFELIPAKHPDLNGKGIAFLIIALMAVMSLVVLMIQVVSMAST
ncbi:hypothetical protein DQQ10_15435 [Pseudochryseolinea flava]|uniref:Uncharacterized protein n=1 Tax=Pseudochryseolinea flava TaxID=2059302 RepID=A0A364Y1F0_9BACT|nr:hypothetical protein DQQ10_15435 [Pseudochryseolinea flava]